MPSNEEIMDMLKLILDKVEHLESITAENITINSGTITIQSDKGSIEIEEAEEIIIQTGQHNQIKIEQVEDLKVDTQEAENVTLQCQGSINGDIDVQGNSAASTTVSIVCNGDIHGDVYGEASEEEE